MDLCKLIPRRKSGRWWLPKRWKACLEDITSRRCCFIGHGRESICTASLTLTSERLLCTEREHPCLSRYLKSCREERDRLGLGDSKIKEAFHHDPNFNHMEKLQGCLQDCLANSCAFPSFFCLKSSQENCRSCIKGGNPLSKNTGIQWIHAVHLLQKGTTLWITRHQIQKAHFLWSLSLEGLMGSGFSCTAIHLPAAPDLSDSRTCKDSHWIHSITVC